LTERPVESEPSSRRPPHNMKVGVTVCGVVIVALISAIYLYHRLYESSFFRAQSEKNPLLVAAVIVVAFAVLMFLMSVAKGALQCGIALLARSPESLLKKDARRPMLYLRSFCEDAGVLSGKEAVLQMAFHHFGHIVAFGRPGEPMQAGSIPRYYVPYQTYRERLLSHIEDASLVIIAGGTSENLAWELEHVLVNADPEKVLLFFPHGGRKTSARGLYREFLIKGGHLFPKPLPNELRRSGSPQFLAFDSQWRPKLLSPSRSTWGRHFLALIPMAGELANIQAALIPFYQMRQCPRALLYTWLSIGTGTAIGLLVLTLPSLIIYALIAAFL